MTDRTLVLLGRIVATVTIACGLFAVVVLIASDGPTPSMSTTLEKLSGTIIPPAVVLIALPRVPRNGSVWAFAFVGLFLGFQVLGDAVAWAIAGIDSAAVTNLATSVAPADIPLSAAIGVTVALTAWIPGFILIPTLVLLLFPDGRFPDPQRWWRWVGRLTIGLAIVAMMAIAFQYPPTSTTPYRELTSDITPASAVAGIGTMLFIVLAVVSIVGYGLKWKRATGDVRLQYRWVGFAFFGFSIWTVASIVLDPFIDGSVDTLVSWVMIILIPISYAIAITRYRLFEIDVVVSKALTFGVLAVFITGVYALVVVGVGSSVGRADDPSLVLSILAVTLVALVFEPVRSRVQHWANVLVYGERATPYEVLSGATARFVTTSDPDDVLTELTSLIGQGTGASEVVVWLAVGKTMVPRSTLPGEVLASLAPVALPEDAAALPGDRVVPVRHQGEVLGAISITKGSGDVVTDADERVLADVAAGAGVLLRNMGLNAELVKRADQLRVSRRRLVAAHDAERHRLERDLHDGAQQQVVALKVKLGIARTLAEREGAADVAGLVESLADTTQTAVDGMRAIAHGIYPPLLEAEGLAAALGASARTLRVPVEVVTTDVDRYGRTVEEGIYFAVLGTVTRAVGAGATRAIITLTGTDDAVAFAIDVDATPPDLIAVEDRIDALDGTLTTNADGDVFYVEAEVPRVAQHPAVTS